MIALDSCILYLEHVGLGLHFTPLPYSSIFWFLFVLRISSTLLHAPYSVFAFGSATVPSGTPTAFTSIAGLCFPLRLIQKSQ